MKPVDPHTPFSIGGDASSFANLQAQNDEKIALQEELRVLREAVGKLTSAAAEAQSDRASSLTRIRRTKEERTLEWWKKPGVQ